MMKFILSWITFPVFSSAVVKIYNVGKASKFEKIFYTNFEKWLCEVSNFIYFFFAIGIIRAGINGILHAGGDFSGKLSSIAGIMIIIIFSGLGVTFILLNIYTIAPRSKAGTFIKKTLNSDRYISGIIYLLFACIVLSEFILRNSIYSDSDLFTFLWECLVVNVVYTGFVTAFLNLIVHIRNHQYFYFIAGKKVPTKYYIHYAVNKEYVLCGFTPDINRAKEAKYFRIDEIKSKYVIKYEEELNRL